MNLVPLNSTFQEKVELKHKEVEVFFLYIWCLFFLTWHQILPVYIYIYIYSISFIWTSFTNSYKSESICQGFQDCFVGCASHLFYNVRTCILLLFCRNIEKNWQIILQRAPKITQLHDKIIFYFKYKFTISLI